MIDISLFHFLRPQWLWALVPLLTLVGLIKYFHKQKSGWQGVLAGHLYQHLMTSNHQGKNRPPLSLLALGWIITTLALAGPTWEQLPQPVYQLHTGKVIVMDMSMSMRATDIKPDRLTRARYKAIDLLNAMGEGETGLVAYAGDAFLISPLTSDVANLTALIPSLSPEIMPEAGSEPFLGLKTATDMLNNAGYQEGEIFWLTDGIDVSQVAEVNQLINEIPYRISVLGIGTEEGAPIKLTNGELLKNRTGAIVIPKLASHHLKAIAQKGLGRYAPMQADDSDIEYLTTQALVSRETESQQQESNLGDEWKETGPYLLLILLPLAAYGFRKGLLTCVPLLLIGQLAYSPEAQADWWDNLWQTRDQQAQKAFDQENYPSAAALYQDPLWLGSAHYRNGDYEAAAQAFGQSDTDQGWYNLGNSLAQLQKLDEAIGAYEQALQHNPDHQDARFNKELLEKMKQQQQNQQQQQDQDQQNQDQNQEQDQEKNQQNQNKDDSTGDGTQDQQQNQQDGEQQQEEDEEQQQDEQQQQGEEQNGQEQESQQGEEPTDAQQQAEELTEEQKEQMKKMENWLRKIPDDPAYLLKRKMQLEHQQRRRQQVPSQQQRNW